jgi:hypothetical protein
MKWIITLCIMLCFAMTGFAQTDTTGTKTDTIKVGGMIIIRRPGGNDEIIRERKGVKVSRRRDNDRASNVSTNWFILDLGFSNYDDQTNYSTTDPMRSPIVTKEAMKLRTWKSRNVNFWFFMQKVNVIKHVVNLKYGLGLELNNYFYDEERLTFQKNPTFINVDPLVTNVKKNKLAADYLTLPAMININFAPRRDRNYGISFGASVGYLYSSRHKTKNVDDDVTKVKDDFNLEKWKISYVGELLIGQVKLYGSYATKSMWEKGLEQTPYTVGFRFSNW